jgi:hypothetical protein
MLKKYVSFIGGAFRVPALLAAGSRQSAAWVPAHPNFCFILPVARYLYAYAENHPA